MQPHEPPPAVGPRPPAEFPDDCARTENEPVSVDFEPGTGRKVKKSATVFVALLVLAFVAVRVVRFVDARALAQETEAGVSAAPPVDTVVAQAASASLDLVLPGQTAAWYETTLYARVNGYVGQWRVDIGDHVKKGQTLALIETPELDAELNAARAQLKASEAQVAARRAEAEFSRTTNERWRDAPKGVVSEQEREAKKADYDGAKARLYAAQSQVNLDEAHVAQYEALAEFKRVTAPFDGTITERRIDIGNLVTAGSSSTTTPLYKMAQTDPLRLFVDVPQRAAEDLMTAGVPVQMRPAGSDKTYSGKIARAAQAINAQARTMRVEVDLPNPDHALVPGMYAHVHFKLAPKGLVEVPAAALVFHAKGTQVAKVDAGGRIVFADVSIARDDGNIVELDAGVQPGERLVLNVPSQIVAGQRVRVDGTPAQAGAGGAGRR